MGNKRLFVLGILFLFVIFLIGVVSGQCPPENLKTLTIYSDDADADLVPSNGEILIEVSNSAWFGKDLVGGGAEWVWADDYNSQVDDFLNLTKIFNIPGTVEKADFIFGIDNFLTLYVNPDVTGGVKVLDHVPSMATPPEGICSDTSSGGLACCFCEHHHSVDISSYLTTGENEIVFETIGYGIPGSTATSNPAGLIYRIDVDYCEALCPCSSGPCCDGCNYLPAGTDCGVCAACDGNGANEENCVYDETQDVDCDGNDIAEIATCLYDPDAIDVTYDYYAGFNSECAGIGSCTGAPANWQDLITHTCDVTNCGAECGSDEDCVCGSDDCVGNDYYDYPDYGICTASCLCDLDEGSGEPCEPEIIMNDPRCQEVCDNGIDDDEDSLIDCDDPDCLGRAGPGGIICCAEQETYKTRLCSEGVCTTNEGDGACCDNNNDCVFGGECYTYFEYGECGGLNNSCLDLGDESTDLEVCMVAGWVDPDNNRAACEEVNNTPRQTSWMIDGACGMRELGEGNCNDVNSGTANFCCGDDEKEIVREGFDDVCFVREEDCYLDGEYYLNDTYSEDNYCENGVITSRTKLIALQLLDIADQTEKSRDNYTLFCDSYENTLNYYGYQVFGVPITQHLNETNNFCVLKLPDQVIFGTSLNKPIDEGPLRFIDTLTDVYDCDDAMGENDGLFHQCYSGNSKAWYNNKTQSVIYSNTDILNNPPQFEINFWETFLTFLKNPFQKIFNLLLALFEEETEWEPEDYEFIKSTKKFSRLYLDRKNVKSIKGIAEEFREPIEREYISVTYNCYSANICRTVNMTYTKFEREGLLGRKDIVLCDYNPIISTYYVASNSSLAVDLWPELTARLRTEGVEIPDTSLIPHIKAPSTTIMGYPITLDAEVEGCNPPFSYTWADSFGEEIPNVKNPTPTFTQLGAHTITLTVTDTDLDGSHESDTVTSVVDVIPLEDCTVKTKQEGCGEDNCILSLSDVTDAHSTKQCDSDFEYMLCCPNVYELDTGCQEVVISLSNLFDAHANAPNYVSFTNPICVRSTIDGTTANCREVTDPEDCNYNGGEICIVSLSDTEDAHLSQCEGTQFGVKVCCKIE